MFNFGIGELVVIFLIVLVLFGAARLPAIAKALGRSIGEFKKASKEDVDSDIEEVKED